MSFLSEKRKFDTFDFDAYLRSVTERDVAALLFADSPLTPFDFLALLSPAADNHLETLAQQAHQLTRLHFGKTIVLFTPLYLADFCDNVCPYCSFARNHKIGHRRKLSLTEIEAEATHISKSGLRHILILTGESRKQTSPSYLIDAVHCLRRHFSSIAIEIYPLTDSEYGELIQAGADNLTLYQETYDEPLYLKLHAGGPKEDYAFRLDAPERALSAKMHSVNIGALLGLNDPVRDAFFTALHLSYLQSRFPEAEIGLSLPRLRPQAGDFTAVHTVSDRFFVRLLTAFRLFAPRAGITLSTREAPDFRNHLMQLGVTRMSAGVCTAVGGHAETSGTPQFEISDNRSVAELSTEIKRQGFQSVLCDWSHTLLRD